MPDALPDPPPLPTSTVTFVYTDLEGSSRLWEQQPAAMRVAVERHFDLLRGAIHAQQGHVFRTVGDLGEHRLRDLARPEHVFQVRHPDLRADFPPLRSLDTRPHNLPLQPTSFIGRERELTAVEQLVAKHRLVTLTGPGGAGKTRLAQQVAADVLPNFPQGVWLADVAYSGGQVTRAARQIARPAH